MTICVIVKLQNAIIAVADGRLSTGDTLSFNSAEKIVQLSPSYKVPVFSMGRINHFAERKNGNWFVAYSGTYALCSEVISRFRKISTGLVLDREDGTGRPVLVDKLAFAHSYSDDCNFDEEELIPLGHQLVRDFFKEALQEKADEWILNGKQLDCQFLLFGYLMRKGSDVQEHYPAYKITVEVDVADGKRTKINVEPVATRVPTCIGDVAAVSLIMRDHDLQTEINAAAPEITAPASDLGDWLNQAAASDLSNVEHRLVKIIRDMNVDSVGGQLLVASARNGQAFSVKQSGL